jgi:hypothetical protein
MTVTVNSRVRFAAVVGIAVALGVIPVVRAEDAVLELRASVVGERGEHLGALRVEVLRWSTDAERAPMLTALSAPTPAPAAAAPSPSSTTPPAAGGRAGRGGRGGGGGGGRGGGAPATPQARLNAAIKAAPTVGFIWADGPTGYSIKYAWQSASTDAARRIVLVTERRIGAHQPLWSATALPENEAEFTVIEFHLDAAHHGEAKTSLVSDVAVDAAAKTLALAKYATAPVQLRVAK